MDNIETTNTAKTNSSKILIYIVIIAVIIGLVWYLNRGNSERFSNEELYPELKSETHPEIRRKTRPFSRTNNQKQENESKKDVSISNDIDEIVRRQAIANHQTFYKMSNDSTRQSAEIKPFEQEDNPHVQFAKDSQYIANVYRPNDIYKQVPYDNGNFYELTADDRTIALMNQIDSNKNINDVACNLSNTLSEEDKDMLADYKNKYYNMYAHQISCANSNGKLSGCGKRCYANGMSPVKCTTQSCNDSMNELNDSADFVSLNQLILEKNNSRPCSTCTQGPMLSRAVGVQNILDKVSDFDNVSRSFMNSQVLSKQPSGIQENFQNVDEELKAKDKELSKKKKVSFANVNNYANFNNYVNQNGILETSVDKLAEIRSDVTNNATCGLNKYGQTIAQVYDNLMSNTYMEYKKSCDVNKITGITDNKINDFQGNGNFGGNYSSNFASINS